MNWYVYCEANPLVNVDPWGEFVVGIGLGAQAVAGIGVLGELCLYFDGNGDAMLAVTVGGQYQVNVSASLYMVVYYSYTMNSVDDVVGVSGGLYISYSAASFGFSAGISVSANNVNVNITATKIGPSVSISPVTYSQQLVITIEIIKFNLKSLFYGSGNSGGKASTTMSILAQNGVFVTGVGTDEITFARGERKVVVKGSNKNLYFNYKIGCA